AVSRREFWDQLAVLRATGLTIVVSTPYMDEALRCDRVALIHGGRILEIDPPGTIGQRYELPLIAVRGANRYGLLQELRQFPHQRTVYLFGAELHYTDKRATTPASVVANEIREYLVQRGHPDAIAEPMEAGIEDSFMALMGASPAPPAA
ncbi:MAG: ABC transporter ATP-binding protein, partial [Thermoanaerobaculia bacterium]